jgi:hypothetical protein
VCTTTSWLGSARLRFGTTRTRQPGPFSCPDDGRPSANTSSRRACLAVLAERARFDVCIRHARQRCALDARPVGTSGRGKEQSPRERVDLDLARHRSHCDGSTACPQTARLGLRPAGARRRSGITPSVPSHWRGRRQRSFTPCEFVVSRGQERRGKTYFRGPENGLTIPFLPSESSLRSDRTQEVAGSREVGGALLLSRPRA